VRKPAVRQVQEHRVDLIVVDAMGIPAGIEVAMLVLRGHAVLTDRDRAPPLVYDGTDPGTAKAQASASGNLARVLRVAGLSGDRSLNPTSIRNACDRRLHDDGIRLEQIAAAMGAKSLDRLWSVLAEQGEGAGG
jgi:hypothetical protein